ncbi:hypothetical protein QBC36DRAFT_346621 [Triangularia setosa]|uniref:Uncharacterized protein n=1 Tax=Triangularia setosa TaxID=2587417 RepID=A0AAN6W6G5_9PEZI|nr:hypothetical protein QBC36DRAFT_346621 [Podospora setosa]
MTRGNSPGTRGSRRHGSRDDGGSRGRGGGRGRGRGRYVGAACAASLAGARDVSEPVLSDITVVLSPSAPSFVLRRDPADASSGNNWFGPVSGSVLLKYFNKSLDSPECYQFQTINGSEANLGGVAFAIINDDDQPLWNNQKKAALVSQIQEATEEENIIRVIGVTAENIKFGRYGLEDSPDMELFIHMDFALVVLPIIKQKKKHENLNLVGCNNTSSIKYTPGPQPPPAVFKTLPDDGRIQYLLWFRIVEVELFAAHSAALLKNFHQIGLDSAMDAEWAAARLSKEGQYRLGQKDEHARTVENKGSDWEGFAGERRGNPIEQLLAGNEACVSDGDACPTIMVTPAEEEEGQTLVERVRNLTVDER